jgi:transposase-like protein
MAVTRSTAETISRITDRVIEEMQSWQARPLDEVYAAIVTDAVVVKIRDGQVANRPIYAAIGVTLAGDKDILGLWVGTGGRLPSSGWRCSPTFVTGGSRTRSLWSATA